MLLLCYKMMNPSISDSDVFTALRSFLQYLFPNVEIIQSQQNRNPPPKGAFIAMNNVGKRRLATNWRTYTNTEEQKTQNTVMPTEYTIQVDFYGKQSGERAQVFCALFFDYTGSDAFPKNIRPLYVTDPVQLPLITGEKQCLERWKTEVKIQFNPVISTPMEFLDRVSISLIPVPLEE